MLEHHSVKDHVSTPCLYNTRLCVIVMHLKGGELVFTLSTPDETCTHGFCEGAGMLGQGPQCLPPVLPTHICTSHDFCCRKFAAYLICPI